MTGKYAIYGTGGAARDVLGPLRAQLATSQHNARIAFVDDDTALHGTDILGHPVLGYSTALGEGFEFSIAISNARIRQNLAQNIQNDGGSIFSILAPTFIHYDSVTLGPGPIISDHVLISTNVMIGAHFHANYYSHVSHDCVIGDFVTFAPRVSCNGNVTIRDRVYIGTGAVLKQGITIGAGATVGMGAVVTKDVAAGITVVGNPARPLTSRPLTPE